MKKIVKWVIWIVSMAFYLFMATVEMPKASKHLSQVVEEAACATIPDFIYMTVTEEKIHERYRCMGEEGRMKYVHIAKNEDTLYPISYGLFFSLTLFFLISYTVEQKRVAWSLALMPIIAAISDLYENKNFVLLAQQYPDFDEQTLSMATTGNVWKWLFVSLSGVVLIVYGFRALAFLISNRKK